MRSNSMRLSGPKGTSLYRQNRRRLRLHSLPCLHNRLRRWNSSASTQTPTSTTDAPVIFSGIQPTGVPHLGNYLGALREWVRLQDNATEGTKLIFSIVDLHALTLPQDAHQLKTWRKESFATLLAVGLDPNRSTIFYQSNVSVASMKLTATCEVTDHLPGSCPC